VRGGFWFWNIKDQLNTTFENKPCPELAADFQEIEPEHMLMALLRFVELDRGIFQDMIQEPELAETMENDRLGLHALFRTMKTETTTVRRSIRKEMGTGKRRGNNTVIHRSGRTKQLFTLAFQLAIEDNSPV